VLKIIKSKNNFEHILSLFFRASPPAIFRCEAQFRAFGGETVATDKRVELRPDLELERMIPVPQAAEINCMSKDTFVRNHSDIIVKLSARRVGVRLRDALAIGSRPVA
jgi:hypothetical protein